MPKKIKSTWVNVKFNDQDLKQIDKLAKQQFENPKMKRGIIIRDIVKKFFEDQ